LKVLNFHLSNLATVAPVTLHEYFDFLVSTHANLIAGIVMAINGCGLAGVLIAKVMKNISDNGCR
jgi:hypothetical protein